MIGIVWNMFLLTKRVLLKKGKEALSRPRNVKGELDGAIKGGVDILVYCLYGFVNGLTKNSRGV
jgi:hypothetical protein